MRGKRWLTVAALVAGTALPGAAYADDTYPPTSHGYGTVSSSRVAAGGCVTFGGDEFAPAASIALADDQQRRGEVTATASGTFSAPVCFAEDAKPGRHVLSGTGKAAGPSAGAAVRRSSAPKATTRTVTAVVYVTGVSETAPTESTSARSGAATQAGSGRLAFTGLDAIAMTAGATLLIAIGCLLLIATERRHQRLRRTA